MARELLKGSSAGRLHAGVKEKKKSRSSYMVVPFTEMENSVEEIEVRRNDQSVCLH